MTINIFFFNKPPLFVNIHRHFTKSAHTLKCLIWDGLFILSNTSNNEVQIYLPPCNNPVSAFEMSTSEGCVLSESSSMQLAGSLCIWIYWELIYLCILVHSHCVLHRTLRPIFFGWRRSISLSWNLTRMNWESKFITKNVDKKFL